MTERQKAILDFFGFRVGSDFNIDELSKLFALMSVQSSGQELPELETLYESWCNRKGFKIVL